MAKINKKELAEKLKKHLNSPEYIAMPDLISSGDYHGHLFALDLKDRDGWIYNWRKEDWGKIKESQLEPNDWEEIINLIEKRNQEREQNWQAKRKNIEQKLNSRSDLYYYWGKSELRKNERADGWHSDKGMRGFCCFLGGNGNGLNHHLYIAENHPVLDSFSFQAGFYLIDNDKSVEKNVGNYEGGFGCSSGKTNPNNWQKYVEVSDQVTITPYEVENDSELVETEKTKSEAEKIKDCNICRKNENEMDNGTEKWYNLRRYHGQKSEILHACSNCYKNKEQEYLENYEFIFSFPKKDLTHEGVPFILETIKGGKTDCYAGKKDPNSQVLQQQNCHHCQPWKNQEVSNLNDKEIIKFLLHYFQQHNIKKIKLVNGELVIECNDKETISQTKNNQELQLAKNIIQTSNKQELTREALNSMVNVNTNSTLTEKPKNNNGLWIGVGLGGILIIGVVIGLAVRKQRVKNK